MLSKEEYKRYNRHLILDQVQIEGQEKLKAAKVLVVGAGGLGCPILQYLTAAGVGTIGVIDFDTVDISNLQRQVLFRTDDVGKNKAEIACKHLSQLNPLVNFEVYPIRLTQMNAISLFDKYDIIVDGSDNFSTRYLVNDASLLAGKPLVYGSIYTFQGQVSVFNYQNGPSYRCLFPTPPKEGTIKNCSEIGVIGVLPGIIGTQQANEVIKLILEIGKPLAGRLLIYDALETSYMEVGVVRSAEEITKVMGMKDHFESFNYDLFCGVSQNLESFEIDMLNFRKTINDQHTKIIDLREEWEEPELVGDNVERITLSEFPMALDRFKSDKRIILVCQTGMRSRNVRLILEKEHGLKNIIELKEGLEQYDN